MDGIGIVSNLNNILVGCSTVSNIYDIVPEDLKFDLIIDKGCFDCIFSRDFPNDKYIVDNFTRDSVLGKGLLNICQLLNLKGVYVLITICNPESIYDLLKEFFKDFLVEYESISKLVYKSNK